MNLQISYKKKWVVQKEVCKNNDGRLLFMVVEQEYVQNNYYVLRRILSNFEQKYDDFVLEDNVCDCLDYFLYCFLLVILYL